MSGLGSGMFYKFWFMLPYITRCYSDRLAAFLGILLVIIRS